MKVWRQDLPNGWPMMAWWGVSQIDSVELATDMASHEFEYARQILRWKVVFSLYIVLPAKARFVDLQMCAIFGQSQWLSMYNAFHLMLSPTLNWNLLFFRILFWYSHCIPSTISNFSDLSIKAITTFNQKPPQEFRILDKTANSLSLSCYNNYLIKASLLVHSISISLHIPI